MNRFIRTFQISVLLACVAANTFAADHATTLEPYLTADVGAIAYADLSKIDPSAVASWIGTVGSLSSEEQADLGNVAKQLQGVIDGLKNLGVQRIYWLLRTSDIANQGPTWVIPLDKDANAQNIQVMLMFGSPEQENYLQTAAPPWVPPHWQVDVHNALVGGYNTEQVAAQLKAEPASDRQLSGAWDALGDGSCGLVIMGTADTRRVVREMLPPLPAPLDTVDGGLLADKVRWGGVVVTLPPQLAASIEVETTDHEAAVRLSEAITGGWQMLAMFDGIHKFLDQAEFQSLLDAFAPRVDGTRLTISPTEITDNAERLAKLLGPPIQQARQAAQRSTRINQFKQIALAVHNYADRYKMFPSQASRDAQDKLLLSWRVHLLPYLEQGALYKQFHLDEPWDSEHNRKLIEKMPSIYSDPDPALSKLVAAGETTYVFPVGQGTVHEGPEPKMFKDMIDGTSNTIMLVEVSPENAVIWTKPADWEVDFGNPWQGLRRNDRDWFVAGFWDASVSIFDKSMDSEKLSGLITNAGGEIVKR